MKRMTVALAADHAGFVLKTHLVGWLSRRGIATADLGTDSEDAVDYPDFAEAVVGVLRNGDADRGVLICGSGIGMSIAANRHRGIRAALAFDAEAARLARRHNDANILVLPGRRMSETEAEACVDAFLAAAFEGGRHGRRLDKIAVGIA
ncbi:MAG: ribose 5-phosphate isomerase B [Defluviicoccus sp.]|nr:ribose 5-phosphate isomerase B [Defluviicoccus sp.]MDE0383617.1 ribose 5-phosphate isomerase B [Defluviicoccus sp.]